MMEKISQIAPSVRSPAFLMKDKNASIRKELMLVSNQLGQIRLRAELLAEEFMDENARKRQKTDDGFVEVY